MLYDVHIYATVRVKVKNIEANTTREGIKKAAEETDLTKLFPHKVLDHGRIETEYGEEVTSYLVDVVGDIGYSQSIVFNADEELTESDSGGNPGLVGATAAETGESSCDLPAAIQTHLGNANYYGDGYTLVLTADIEAVQAELQALGITPNEPEAYPPS